MSLELQWFCEGVCSGCKRVLKLFPGVFTGIGEFTIHKEFVSSKIAGDVASLTNKAVDRLIHRFRNRMLRPCTLIR